MGDGGWWSWVCWVEKKKGVTLLMILVQRREGEMSFCFGFEFVFVCDFGGWGLSWFLSVEWVCDTILFYYR